MGYFGPLGFRVEGLGLRVFVVLIFVFRGDFMLRAEGAEG